MSKYLTKLTSIYENLNLSSKSEECEDCGCEADDRNKADRIADEFQIVHEYMHPSSSKRCYCMMRKHENGYNILDMDEDGNLVVDVFSPKENDEEAENPALKNIFGAPINPTEIALVKTLAGDQMRGGLFNNPQKDMEKAYGTLISKLANKIKVVANGIK